VSREGLIAPVTNARVAVQAFQQLCPSQPASLERAADPEPGRMIADAPVALRAELLRVPAICSGRKGAGLIAPDQFAPAHPPV
jgi:hypothetical protein